MTTLSRWSSRPATKLDVIIVPKPKAPRDIWFFDTLLTQIETKMGLAKRIGLEALIEESAALSRVEEIAACCPRLEALILGFGDLSASQGMRFGVASDPANRYPGDIWHHARVRMISACRANGLDAIDGPFGNFRDPEGYRREATWAATLGAVGKWAIHPSQIDIANEVFAPTAARNREREENESGLRCGRRGRRRRLGRRRDADRRGSGPNLRKRPGARPPERPDLTDQRLCVLKTSTAMEWRNGRRAGLRILFSPARVGREGAHAT